MLTFANDPKDDRVFIDETESRNEYFCPYCGAPLVTKKGRVRQHHFAHKATHRCSDSWTEHYDISDWHFDWQERFPRQNREICLKLGSIRHRADVIVGRTVVEFQKSPLSQGQFNDRNSFYHDLGYKVVWLFDMEDLYANGAVSPAQDDAGDAFVWENPKKAFNAYDLSVGNIDLFFQLEDEGEGCLVKVAGSSSVGFERFTAAKSMSKEGFFKYLGFGDSVILGPDLNPLEPNADYIRFRARYRIELNPQQERAVQAVDGANLLIAVPGSGKTTVLVNRLGYMVIERKIDPSKIMSVTYTTAAAADMRKRFADSFGDQNLARRMQFSTINSLALKIYRAQCTRSRSAPKKLIQESERKKLLREICKKRSNGEWVTDAEVKDLASTISYIKNMMLGPEEIKGLETVDPHLSEKYQEYQQGLFDSGLMDFDDQLVFALDALRLRDGVRDEMRGRYSYLCVDEAQDTSRIQHNIIYLLASGSGNIFMVGDEDQSVYGFRAAYPKAMLNFKHIYDNAFVMQMSRSYRSGSEITDLANRFIRGSKGRYEKQIISDRGPGSKVALVDVASRDDQYRAVIEETKKMEGRTAVLFRESSGAIPLVDLLLRDNIPFNFRGGEDTFLTGRISEDILSFLRLSLDHADEKSFMRIYFKCSCYLKKQDAKWACRNKKSEGGDILVALVKQAGNYRKSCEIERTVENAKRLKTLVERTSRLTPTEAIEAVLDGGYSSYLKDSGQSLSAVGILKSVASSEKTIGGFLDRIEYLKREMAPLPKSDPSIGLTLSTIHSSKGLEFDSVVIIDAFDGLLPTSKRTIFNASKDSADAYQEERRLFYVAMTRARDNLTILRVSGEKASFIDELFPRRTESCDGAVGYSGERLAISAPIAGVSGFGKRAAPFKGINQRLKDADDARREEERTEKEKLARKRMQEMKEGLEEALPLIDREDILAKDSYGRRWAKCEICGEVKVVDEFQSYGGKGHYNYGRCNDCVRRERLQEGQPK